MRTTLILGTQWGDEGKGKIIDFLSQKADVVVRFQGGNNAGHTVINPLGTFKLHLIPSGIFNPKATVTISNGTVLDLHALTEEIESIQKAGIKFKDRFYISPRCHIILPYHKLLEKAYEKAKGKGKIGTTGRGIGPVYADKVSYNGIRLSDVMDKKKFAEKLNIQLKIKNKLLKALGEKPLRLEEIENEMDPLRVKIRPFVKEPFPIIHTAIKNNNYVLFEGAQAVFLDNDWGTYPYVTASTVVSGGITAGAGVPPSHLKQIVGVIKAYTTRVGEGPFPTELLDKTGERIRTTGNEYGATTGRPRRCGWLDLEMVKFAIELNGITELALTKLDVLDEFDEIKLCTGYTLRSKPVKYYDGDDEFLTRVKPIYKSMPGWKTTTKGITDYKALPKKAINYIQEVENITGIKVTYISTGPARSEIISR